MGESSAHSSLVTHLVQWVAEEYLSGKTDAIQIDSGGCDRKPPSAYGYVPDVYVAPMHTGRLIIGEAKTIQDFETRHSFEQIAAFLKKCSESEGAIFVFAIPWHRTRLAKSILSLICERNSISNVHIVVIDKLPG